MSPVAEWMRETAFGGDLGKQVLTDVKDEGRDRQDYQKASSEDDQNLAALAGPRISC